MEKRPSFQARDGFHGQPTVPVTTLNLNESIGFGDRTCHTTDRQRRHVSATWEQLEKEIGVDETRPCIPNSGRSTVCSCSDEVRLKMWTRPSDEKCRSRTAKCIFAWKFVGHRASHACLTIVGPRLEHSKSPRGFTCKHSLTYLLTRITYSMEFPKTKKKTHWNSRVDDREKPWNRS